MSNLAGKVAVISGGTSGIGLATAEALSNKGVKLVLHGRREALLAEHAERLGDCTYLARDIEDPSTAQALLDLALDRFGRCDIAFNNAGLNHSGAIEDIDIELMCEMIRVNVEAACRFAYTMVKHFKAQGSGHLLNTSSILGTKVRRNVGPYCATKFAMEALAEALRMELAGTGIKVSCVQPGLVVTDLHRGHAVQPAVAQNIPEPLHAADVADAVVFALERPAHVLVPRIMLIPAAQPE